MKMFKTVLILLTSGLLANAEEVFQFQANAGTVIVENVSFINLGTYRGFTDEGSEYKKTYFMSRYMKNTWGEARAICRSFDFELATFETLSEAKAFLSMADNNSYFKSFANVYFIVDGTTLTPKSTTDWYWPQTGKKIQFPIPWGTGQPDLYNNNPEFCFSFGRRSANENFGFNDLQCFEAVYQFVCQRIDFFIPY